MEFCPNLISISDKEYACEERLHELIANASLLKDEGIIDDNCIKSLKRYANQRQAKDTFTVAYSYSKNSLNQQGRQFVDNGLQRFPTSVRSYLLNDKVYDLDMENAQPALLYQYAKKLRVP